MDCWAGFTIIPPAKVSGVMTARHDTSSETSGVQRET